MKWLALVAMASVCAGCGQGMPASAASDTAVSSDAGRPAERPIESSVPEYREITLPAGTTLRLQLTSAIGSDSSQVEDTVHAELRQPLRIEGHDVLPTGTEVVGSVTDVKRSGRVKGLARIAYRFDSLHYDRERYEIRTASISHQARPTKGQDAKKIAIGAGAGAALGAILGGGSGAAKGAAIGGAGGTGVVLATRGKDVRLGPGTDVNARLTAPLTIRVKA